MLAGIGCQLEPRAAPGAAIHRAALLADAFVQVDRVTGSTDQEDRAADAGKRRAEALSKAASNPFVLTARAPRARR